MLTQARPHWLAIELVLVLVRQRWRWLRLGVPHLGLWFVLPDSDLSLERSKGEAVRVEVLCFVRREGDIGKRGETY